MLIFVLLILLAEPLLAEQTPPTAAAPTLDEILHHIRDNLERYRKLVPNFYCKEPPYTKSGLPGHGPPTPHFELRATQQGFWLSLVS